jgi:hypothetical protein
MRHTGPGRVIDNFVPGLNPGGRYTYWKFLANFDTDGERPKDEHKAWLTEHLLRPGPAESPWVFLRGWASRLGSAQHNKLLSLRRVRNVQAFLESHGYPRNRITGADYVGSSWSGSGSTDNWQHRCVEVIVAPQEPHPPRPPETHHVTALDEINIVGRIARHFKIRVLAELSGGAGVAGNVMLLEIWDTTYGRACRYVFAGSGVGLEIPGAPELGRAEQILQGLNLGDALAGGHGSWAYFHTHHHVEVDAFGGPADYSRTYIGGRRPRGAPPPGAIERFVESNTLRFHAPNPDSFLGVQRISVDLDLPPGIVDTDLPQVLGTRGTLVAIGSPYRLGAGG